jgi:hypothetical protein
MVVDDVVIEEAKAPDALFENKTDAMWAPWFV